IAARSGTDVEGLIAWNALDAPDQILIGQQLFIPPQGYVPEPVDEDAVGEDSSDSANESASLTAPHPDHAARTGQEQFIFSLIDGAQQSQRITGVPTSVTIAQAILETYWGTSQLARQANNYFGIKALT